MDQQVGYKNKLNTEIHVVISSTKKTNEKKGKYFNLWKEKSKLMISTLIYALVQICDIILFVLKRRIEIQLFYVCLNN